MQSIGMVNDHVLDCYRYREIVRLSRASSPPRPGANRFAGPKRKRRR
jgi:hypothetical protein